MNTELIAQLDAEIKAKQELREIALAVEAGAEWEVDGGGTGTDWHDPDNEFAWYFREDRACAWQVRLKPKPVTRPWSKPEDVPGPVCWLRSSGDKGSESLEAMVVAVSKRSMTVLTATEQHIGWHESHKIQRMEYSTDRINWFPCETTEEAE